MKFKVGETYKSRDGRDWVLAHFNGDAPEDQLTWVRPELFKTKGGAVAIQTDMEGRYYGCDEESILDIMPREGYAWLNVYPGRFSGHYYHSRDAANKDATFSRIGCIKVKLEERFDD